MNIKKSIACISVLLAASISTTAAPPKGDGWVALFDGETLTGFECKNGYATYQVEDGAIVGRTAVGSENTFLVTRKEYSDFEIVFQVKVDDGLNSGIQVRSKGRNWGHNHFIGPQIEIESGPGQSGFVYGEGMDTGWISKEPMSDDKNVNTHDYMNNGKWNDFRIVANGPNIKTYINGNLVVDQNMRQFHRNYASGHFGFQVHKIPNDKGPFEVRWRNIYVKEL